MHQHLQHWPCGLSRSHALTARFSAWPQLSVCLCGSQIAVISFNLSQRQRQRQRQQQMLPLAAQIVFVWEIESNHPRSLCKMRIKKKKQKKKNRKEEKYSAVSNTHCGTPPAHLPIGNVSWRSVCQCTIVVCMRKSRLMAFYIICRLMPASLPQPTAAKCQCQSWRRRRRRSPSQSWQT